MGDEVRYVLGGVTYTVKRPNQRPMLTTLTKGNGIIPYIDFKQHFDWLNRFANIWKKESELMKPTIDHITGMLVILPEGEILVKVTPLKPENKMEVYCLDCYSFNNPHCEMQFLACTKAAPARYVVIPNFVNIGRTWKEKEYVETSAQILSAILLSSKMFINITKYEKSNDHTYFEYGKLLRGVVKVEPLMIGEKDYLCDWNF